MSHYTYLEGKGYLVKDNRGFTLIELLTALGLVGLVLSIILSPIIFSYNSFHNQNQKASSISNAGRAMDYITREIRKASEIEVLSDSALKLGSFIYEVDDGVLYKKDQDKGGKKAIVEEYIIKSFKDLHQIPEVGLDLPKTSAYVANELKKMGIEVKEKVAVSGVVGLIRGSEEGKTIALRADMDALPIKEETNLPYASQNGNMHACGHDAHTAILLGVAKVLSENREEIKGNVKLIFQPAEEGPGGAKPIILYLNM